MMLLELIGKLNDRNDDTTSTTIGEQYDVSRRVVTDRLTKHGCNYNASTMKWTYDGDDVAIDELFKKKTRRAKKPQGAISKVKPINSINTKDKPQKRQNEAQGGAIDMIDQLLSDTASGKEKRAYKGYYIDEDVLSVIESVSAGKRSDLINEVLRAAFKERGRL